MRRFIPRQHPFYHEPRFAFGYQLLPENVKVLDYGCHDGAFGQRLTRHKKVEYLGVDKNRDAVRRAPQGILVKELVHPLPFDDAEFDAVTMFEVIEHIYDQEAVLREVRRVLKRKASSSCRFRDDTSSRCSTWRTSSSCFRDCIGSTTP